LSGVRMWGALVSDAQKNDAWYGNLPSLRFPGPQYTMNCFCRVRHFTQ
jgi:hypothetical protein